MTRASEEANLTVPPGEGGGGDPAKLIKVKDKTRRSPRRRRRKRGLTLIDKREPVFSRRMFSSL